MDGNIPATVSTYPKQMAPITVGREGAIHSGSVLPWFTQPLEATREGQGHEHALKHTRKGHMGTRLQTQTHWGRREMTQQKKKALAALFYTQKKKQPGCL